MLVVTGLMLTGELSPGPGAPQPVAAGPDLRGLGGLLQPSTDQAGVPLTPATAPPPTVKTVAPVSTPSTRPAQGVAQAPTTQTTRPPPAPNASTTTSTTLPCNLLGAKGLSAPVPLVCG